MVQYSTPPSGPAGGVLGGSYPNPSFPASGIVVPAGSAVPGAQAGLDEAFANVLRVFNNLPGGTTQYVTPAGGTHNWYVNGVDVFDAVQTFLQANVLFNHMAGTKTSGSAPAIVPAFASGAAAQLADTTRDYNVYLQIGTPGTAFTLAIGPTSGVATTIMASGTPQANQLISFRLPAGWFVQWAGTGTTLTTQAAVGC